MDTLPTVQLRHDQPEGHWHIDWMLASDDHADLITVRLPDRLERLEIGSEMAGTWLGRHRRRYLTYEGPLSQDRGRVQRVAEGRVLNWESAGDEWWITVEWSGGLRQDLVIIASDGDRQPGQICRVRRQSADGPSSPC